MAVGRGCPRAFFSQRSCRSFSRGVSPAPLPLPWHWPRLSDRCANAWVHREGAGTRGERWARNGDGGGGGRSRQEASPRSELAGRCSPFQPSSCTPTAPPQRSQSVSHRPASRSGVVEGWRAGGEERRRGQKQAPGRWCGRTGRIPQTPWNPYSQRASRPSAPCTPHLDVTLALKLSLALLIIAAAPLLAPGLALTEPALGTTAGVGLWRRGT